MAVSPPYYYQVRHRQIIEEGDVLILFPSVNKLIWQRKSLERYRNVKQDSSPQIYLSSLIVFLEGDSHKIYQ